MIKFILRDTEGGAHLWLGLSADNLRYLAQDKPIVVSTESFGEEAGIVPGFEEIVIFSGVNEQSMLRDLKQRGLNLPNLPPPFDKL